MDIKQILRDSCSFSPVTYLPPEQSGVYAIGVFRPGAITRENPSGFVPVYIGKAEDLQQRFKERSTSEDNPGLKEYLRTHRNSAEFIYKEYHSSNIEEIEKSLILKFNPEFNRRIG